MAETMIIAIIKGKKLSAKEQAAVRKRVQKALAGTSEVAGQDGETCVGVSVAPVTVSYCK
ncbi:MAG: hypothetical protein ABSA67_06625 [Candidatus Brocadiia bacterium]|jgi:hypothetical protein